MKGRIADDKVTGHCNFAQPTVQSANMQPRTDTPSTDEKAVGVIEPYSPTPDPNDPDAGKTPEEREKIVRALLNRGLFDY